MKCQIVKKLPFSISIWSLLCVQKIPSSNVCKGCKLILLVLYTPICYSIKVLFTCYLYYILLISYSIKVLLTICHLKCITFTQIKNFPKNTWYLLIYVIVQFQVKPLSSGTSSSQTKKKFPKKCLNWSLNVYAKFQVSMTSMSYTSNFKSNH